MIALWIIVGAIVGALIGEKKQAMAQGLFLGLILGPIGWLVMALSNGNLLVCNECKGAVPNGARRCKHCGVVFNHEPPLIKFKCPA